MYQIHILYCKQTFRLAKNIY